MDDIPPNALVIIDDYMTELANSKDFTKLMTKAVHHLPMTLIFITQNMFHKGKDVKTRRMNSNYLIVFKNPHDRAQIDYIGRQMFPNHPQFLSKTYAGVTAKDAYSYLLLDCQQTTPDEIRVRSKITDKHVRVFTPDVLPLPI